MICSLRASASVFVDRDEDAVNGLGLFLDRRFVKDRALVLRVKESLGNAKMKNAALGEMVFDYYVESELD